MPENKWRGKTALEIIMVIPCRMSHLQLNVGVAVVLEVAAEPDVKNTTLDVHVQDGLVDEDATRRLVVARHSQEGDVDTSRCTVGGQSPGRPKSDLRYINIERYNIDENVCQERMN